MTEADAAHLAITSKLWVLWQNGVITDVQRKQLFVALGQMGMNPSGRTQVQVVKKLKQNKCEAVN